MGHTACFTRCTAQRVDIPYNLRGITKLVELEFELRNNPSIAEPLGLSPLKRPPSDEQFSEFLRAYPNEYFQRVREALVHHLITERVISGTGIAVDSCPIEALVRENNLKTSVNNRYDKYHLPSGDRDARLGLCVHFLSPFQRKIHYFWGYRNHILNDLDSELPIVGLTLQANKDEKRVGLSLLQPLHRNFSLPTEGVAGDANYDVEEISLRGHADIGV